MGGRVTARAKTGGDFRLPQIPIVSWRKSADYSAIYSPLLYLCRRGRGHYRPYWVSLSFSETAEFLTIWQKKRKQSFLHWWTWEHTTPGEYPCARLWSAVNYMAITDHLCSVTPRRASVFWYMEHRCFRYKSQQIPYTEEPYRWGRTVLYGGLNKRVTNTKKKNTVPWKDCGTHSDTPKKLPRKSPMIHLGRQQGISDGEPPYVLISKYPFVPLFGSRRGGCLLCGVPT